MYCTVLYEQGADRVRVMGEEIHYGLINSGRGYNAGIGSEYVIVWTYYPFGKSGEERMIVESEAGTHGAGVGLGCWDIEMWDISDNIRLNWLTVQ